MEKIALISGAARGIGKACALAFAQKGYKIALHYNSSYDEALKTAIEIEKKQGKVLCIKADLKDPLQVENLANTLKKTWGTPDVLINNAGISKISMFQDIKIEDWDEMFNCNLKSMYLLTKAFISDMIDRKAGNIVNISSMWGQVGASCEVAYSASKGGVIAFTKALAKELAPSNIRVNCVAPGCIKTDMMAHFSEGVLKELEEETPLGRIGLPEDVANAVVFLASEEASFITGQVLSVNGGMII